MLRPEPCSEVRHIVGIRATALRGSSIRPASAVHVLILFEHPAAAGSKLTVLTMTCRTPRRLDLLAQVGHLRDAASRRRLVELPNSAARSIDSGRMRSDTCCPAAIAHTRLAHSIDGSKVSDNVVAAHTHHSRGQGVHLADEVGHEERRRASVYILGVPSCSTSPEFITTTRSEMLSASSWYHGSHTHWSCSENAATCGSLNASAHVSLHRDSIAARQATGLPVRSLSPSKGDLAVRSDSWLGNRLSMPFRPTRSSTWARVRVSQAPRCPLPRGRMIHYRTVHVRKQGVVLEHEPYVPLVGHAVGHI